jgi:hypothetical protein
MLHHHWLEDFALSAGDSIAWRPRPTGSIVLVSTGRELKHEPDGTLPSGSQILLASSVTDFVQNALEEKIQDYGPLGDTIDIAEYPNYSN